MSIDSVRKSVGQLLLCGFHGTTPSPEIIKLIQHYHVGGIILFSRNIETVEQVKTLTQDLQRIAKEAGHTRPLLIAVDQENGVVQRLNQSGTFQPGSMALGALGSSFLAGQVAHATAQELRALGINWNLAPVVDVNNNPLNPVIGVRSFAENPVTVGSLAMAQVEAYHRSGLATALKHFPGHGDTATDSHLSVPVIPKTIEELEKVELVPFRQAMAAKGDAYPSAVMVGHMVLPKITDQIACLSAEVVQTLLRRRLRYNGVVVTDCLEMDAVKETVGVPKAAVLALQAGVDILDISHTYDSQKAALDAIYGALDEKVLSTSAVEASLNRVAALKDRFLSWERTFCSDPIAKEDHLTLSKQLYERVPTVVHNRANILPLNTKPDILFLAAHVPMTLAIDTDEEPFKPMYESLRKRGNVRYIVFDQHTADLSDQIRKAAYVVIGTANANLYPFQVNMVRLAHKLAAKLIVVSVINPYDLMAFPEIDTYVVTYECSPPALEAAVQTLFGEITPSSRLPVTIPNVDVSQTVWEVEEYNESDLEEVSRLWQLNFGTHLALPAEKIGHVLARARQPSHFVVRGKSSAQVVGFAATNIEREYTQEDVGQLMLLMVDPTMQCQGIGTRLHEHVLDYFRHMGVDRLMLGSTYPRFFPGVPHDQPTAQEFFKRRGWRLNSSVVWDLIGDLENYETPSSIRDRLAKQKVWFGRIKPNELWELYGFVQRYFPFWLSTYQHHAELGDFQDLIVAREEDEHGKLLASLILYTTFVSHEKRSDLIWTLPGLTNHRSGGMACVGVASEERGRGLGLGIVAYANETLKRRGVLKSYVDWVELIDFYRRTGYETWLSYHTSL
ncbi:hypothetical protein EC973_002807 [Apophysomyces ossiformis]|uniref:N-acetyltransferase domain-containing protein n=1 Tax=Apophysomyces ossiformis TaxID=679940 RepID=A0A8H7BW50_9FUNG|nr:hypothetical protein EC973_002807 [Apophysomyces ossiformis]